MNELISIIVPVYNVEKYVERCIQSILNQTYSDFELILVNDGSLDNSGKICDQYTQIDNRIRVFHKTNGGLSDARNYGMKESMGSLITFIDSDDWVHQTYLETLYILMKNHDADLAIGSFQRVKENTSLKEVNPQVYEFNNIQALNELYGEFGYNMTIACNKLYKKQLFDTISFPLNRAHEDEFISYKILFESSKTVLTTQILYYYWQHEHSIMGRGFNLLNTLDAIDAFEERIKYFKALNLDSLVEPTYKSLFFHYASVKHNSSYRTLILIERDYHPKVKDFLSRFSMSNQTKKFKTFAFFHWYLPKVSKLIVSINSKIVGLKK